MIFSWTGNRGGQGSAHNFQRAPGKWRDLKGGGLEGMNLKTRGNIVFVFVLKFFFQMWMMLSPFVGQYYNLI